ncbi:MAG TPA: C40 family peptidase [Ignavibacteriaceae bacterium]
MKFTAKYKIIIAAGFLIPIIISCSSSSSDRYGTKVNTSDPNKSSVRFTSVDDTMVVDLNLDLKDPGDLPAYEPEVDVSRVIPDSVGESGQNSGIASSKEKMMMEIVKYLNTPYKYGGTTKSGIDCSALTQNLFRDVLSIDLLRSARLQYSQGVPVGSKQDLQFGDLVFFNTRQRVKPGHVGIYIGENLFAHASTSKGVTISSMDHDYYSHRYMGGRRIDSNSLIGEK